MEPSEIILAIRGMDAEDIKKIILMHLTDANRVPAVKLIREKYNLGLLNAYNICHTIWGMELK
jgi:hypothetical protein